MFLSRDISFYLISLGCSKNLVDSEIVNGAMRAAGFEASDTPDRADIVIINTCGFIEDAKRESIDVIFDALHDRDACVTNHDTEAVRFRRRVVVAGCLARRYGEELLREIPEIDLLYGIADERLPREIARRFAIRIAAKKAGRHPLTEGLPYAYLKIAEGCSNNCSYCAIPLIRGPHRSRAAAALTAEARDLVRAGAREIILIAQDIAAYRRGSIGLPRLVGMLARLRGLEWIRLLYCHPDKIDDAIIALLRDNDRVVKYIDIPFQHVNRRILRSMGRRGDYGRYLRLVGALRDAVPGIRIRSTFMVGYPGETEEEFRELIRFIREARLDRAGCFIYSIEENTRAARMGGQVTPDVKRARYRAVMKAQRTISARLLRDMIGREVRVLVEERCDDETWIGRTEFDAPEVDGIFYLTARSAALNTIVRARVTGSAEYDLYGVLC